MSFRIVYHPDVIRKDLPRINVNIQRRIERASSYRLTEDPVSYAEPLGQTLHGLLRLRVGDYRVVFRLSKLNLLTILVIAHRKEVYQIAPGRWGMTFLR